MRWAFAVAAFLVGCGGTVSEEPLTLFDDAGNPVDTGTVASAASTPSSVTPASTRATRFRPRRGARHLGRSRLPRHGSAAQGLRCDPLKPPPGDCPKGQACFPYVEYPTSPCEHEIYHAGCFPAGPGKSGDPCSGGDCAAGFICVATGAGNVCVSMCSPEKAGGCPKGYVCSPTDVPGIGGCL